MLQPSANLAADDVTITCKVRRSQHAHNPVFEGGLQEMTCTMRYWQSADTSPNGVEEPSNCTQGRSVPHRRSGSKSSDFNPSVMQLLVGDADKHDPELVLCSVQKPVGVYDGGPIKLSDRFESFGTHTSSAVGSNPGSRHPSVSRSRANSICKSRNSSRQRGRNPSAPRSRPPSRGRRRSAWTAEELKEVPPPHMRQQTPDEKPPEVKSFVVPLSDIVVVDVFGELYAPPEDSIFREKDRLNVTTITNGYYEFYFQTRMSHDILLAFLKANLPAERIADGAGRHEQYIQPNVSNCCSEELFDAETLTAKRMEERVKKERLSERLRRKITHMATRIGELSNNIADCACGGCQISDDYRESPDDARRQSPPQTFEFPADLEFSPTQPMGSHRHLEMSESNMQQTTASSVTPKKPIQRSSSKSNKPPAGFPEGGPLEDVPGVEKISFEDESVSGEADNKPGGAFI